MNPSTQPAQGMTAQGMNEPRIPIPATVTQAQHAAHELGFAMSCAHQTGALLATLAASKPGGRILELGTGTGVGTAWLLSGMTPDAHLVTLDTDAARTATIPHSITSDPRVDLLTLDADTWLDTYRGPGFDLVFVDCRPGKFHRRTDLLHHLNPGALYIGDDLLPQPTWPPDHQPRVDTFLAEILTQPGLQTTVLNWSSGIVLGART